MEEENKQQEQTQPDVEKFPVPKETEVYDIVEKKDKGKDVFVEFIRDAKSSYVGYNVKIKTNIKEPINTLEMRSFLENLDNLTQNRMESINKRRKGKVIRKNYAKMEK